MRSTLTALSTIVIAAVAMLPTTALAAHSKTSAQTMTTTTYVSHPNFAGVVTGGMGDASWPHPLTALDEGKQQSEFAQPESYLPMLATKKIAVLDFTGMGIPTGASVQNVRLHFQLLTIPWEAPFASWMRVDLGYAGTPNSGPCAWIEQSPFKVTSESVLFPYHPTVAELDSGSMSAFFTAENINGPGFASVGVNDFALEVETG